jgi:glutamate racemase
MIESDWEDTGENQKIMRYYVEKMPSEIDVVILGCTHYPIIKEIFKRELKGKKWVDPAKQTALTIKDKLEELGIENKENEKRRIYFYTSGDIEEFKKMSKKILGRRVTKIKNAL